MLREYVYGAPVVDQNPVHIVVGHHGLDDQRIAMLVTNMACVLFTKGDRVCLTSELFGRLPAGRIGDWNRPFLGLFEVAVLGSPRFPSKMRSAEDSFDHTERFCLLSVLAGLGTPVADVVLEVPISDEFFNLILECDTFFDDVANISMVSAVLVLVSL